LVSTTVPRQELARAMGLLQMSVFVGATFGPIGGGAVATLFGFRAAFAGAGFLLALGAVIVFAFVQEPSRTPRLHGETVAAVNRPSLRALLAFPAFAAAVAVTLLVQFATTSMMPALPLYVQALIHTSRGVATDTGWLLAASGLFAAIGSSMAGRLQRRFGLEPLLVAAVLASAILVAPQAFAQSFWVFLLLRASAAGAFGVLFGLVGTWAAVSSPPESRGAAFGLIGAASSLGFGSGPLVGGAIIALFGIRPLFVIAAGILAWEGLVHLALRTSRDPPTVRRLPAVVGRRSSCKRPSGPLLERW
jgi:MFS transporter, DHA1 family, multidrug resistance protein